MTPPSPPPSTSNTLAALLNRPFRCNQCGRTHRPDSRLIARCAWQFASIVAGPELACGWSPARLHYFDRRHWYQHNHRWNATEGRFEQVMQRCGRAGIHTHFAPASRLELSAPNGADLIRTRYSAWHADYQQALHRAQAEAEEIIIEIEQLLPPPHRAQPPEAIRHRVNSTWVPTQVSAAEIHRVAALFVDTFTVTQTRTSDNRAITLQVVFPRRSSDVTRRAIAAAFSAPPIARHGYYFPDFFGLDPVFWGIGTIRHPVFTLVTQPFLPAA